MCDIRWSTPTYLKSNRNVGRGMDVPSMLASTMMDTGNGKGSIADEQYLSEIDQYCGVLLAHLCVAHLYVMSSPTYPSDYCQPIVPSKSSGDGYSTVGSK